MSNTGDRLGKMRTRESCGNSNTGRVTFVRVEKCWGQRGVVLPLSSSSVRRQRVDTSRGGGGCRIQERLSVCFLKIRKS